MKYPKSPDWLDGSLTPKCQESKGDEDEEEEEESKKTVVGHRAKRERRQGSSSSSSSATMCQVCNIQLNSGAQAQIHYRGKTHQRRLQPGPPPPGFPASAGSTPPAADSWWSCDATSPTDAHLCRTMMMIKMVMCISIQVKCSACEGKEMEQMERLQFADFMLFFTNLAMSVILCIYCTLTYFMTQAEAHYKGHKHARKLKAMETQRNLPTPVQPSSSMDSPQLSPQISPGSQLSDPTDSPLAEGCSSGSALAPHLDPHGSSTGDEEVKMDESKEAKSSKKQLHCPTCKVTVNSSSQLEAHCSGITKMTSSPRPTCRIKQRMGSKTRAVVGVHNQPFHCELCQVSVNSETQLKQHMNSRRHKERLAGKPVKPKFTPYNKLQPSAVLATKLALQKQLSKALPAGFLTSPLNPAALCTMASGPLALRLPPGPAAIIQGPLISPTLFRPAPGPLRATHTPIIFSPY
uniref:Zinc finger protein 385C n=1 Tax=Sphaeramia orbicularis TaxID=375764 RepID=A0A673AEH5_9TELE